MTVGIGVDGFGVSVENGARVGIVYGAVNESFLDFCALIDIDWIEP